MRAAALLLALWCASGLASADSPVPERLVFAEVLAERETWYVGESIPVRLRIGFDRERFLEHAAPLFRREMDLPLQVQAPWLKDVSFETRAGLSTSRLVVGDEVVGLPSAPDVTRAGTVFSVLERRGQLPARAPGVLSLAGPTLRYAFATKFRDDFVGGRIAEDARDVAVQAPALELTVRPLPEAGRPASFCGVVGSLAVTADVDTRRSRKNEVLKLTLRFDGRGVRALEPPGADGFPGFHVYGRTDDGGRPDRRTLVYELAPLRDGVAEIPALVFGWFDPTPPGGYREARTQRLALDALADAPHEEPVEAPTEPPSATAMTLGVLLGVLLLALAVFLYLTRAAAQPTPPSARTLPDTAGIVRATKALRDPLVHGGEATAAFVTYLAARLDLSEAAVIDARLAGHLQARGIPSDVAARAAAALEAGIAVRYGASEAGREPVDVALLDELEAGFGAARS